MKYSYHKQHFPTLKRPEERRHGSHGRLKAEEVAT